MRLVALVWLSGMLALAPLRCSAEPACGAAEARARVEVARPELTLADMLAPGACARWQQAAAQISLGAAPRPGGVRVIEGGHVRRWLDELALANRVPGTVGDMKIPERIVVMRAGGTKPCAEIARFVFSAAAPETTSWNSPRPTVVNCAAAGGVPEDAPLELLRTAWNAGLQRWEFALRCVRPGDCVPFLVWAQGEKPPSAALANARHDELVTADSTGTRGARLVQPGQTAMLTWEQAGIRIVLPVTCLDAGALGQTVRVRFKNAARIVRAEVVGAGALRTSL